MTKTQAQIIELFKTLDQTEQREVAQQLYERAVVGSFYDRMTPQQRAELDEGIAQAERGQVRPAEEVFDRLAKRFGFSGRSLASPRLAPSIAYVNDPCLPSLDDPIDQVGVPPRWKHARSCFLRPAPAFWKLPNQAFGIVYGALDVAHALWTVLGEVEKDRCQVTARPQGVANPHRP
jgi:predicted transcriptional regulator